MRLRLETNRSRISPDQSPRRSMVKKVPSEGGWVELPVNVTTYWGVSPKTASVLGGLSAFAAFILGWSPITTLLGSRRSVRCTVHSALLDSRECVFVTVVNKSSAADVEITHVWFETSPLINVVNAARPLPKRLLRDESWATWIERSKLPVQEESFWFDKGRVRLSTGKEIRSVQAKNIPSEGYVPGP
jgi:hypothetical protein